MIERYEWPALDFHVRCSKGTYVRTLVEDIAKAAGTLGHVAALRRLAVDPFDGAGHADVRGARGGCHDGPGALDALLLPADAALPGWPAADARARDVARLARGSGRGRADPSWPCGHVKIYAARAVHRDRRVTEDRRLAPTRVFIR